MSVEAAWLPEPEPTHPEHAEPGHGQRGRRQPVRPTGSRRRVVDAPTARGTTDRGTTEVLVRETPEAVTAESAPPASSTGARAESPARSLGAGLLAAGGTALAGLAMFCVPLVVVWVLSGPALGSLAFTDVLRVSALAWAAAQGATITIGDIPVSLLPIGWAVIPFGTAWVMTRAVRRFVHHPLAFLGVLTGALGCVGATVGLLASAEGAHVGPVRTGAAAALVAGCAGLLALRLPGTWLRRCPVDVARGLRAGLLACALLVGAGLVGVAVSAVVHRDEVLALVAATATGPAGLPAAIAVMAGYLPAAVVWAAAYLYGVGFDFGVLTSPWTSDVYSGPMPAIGWVAALPVGGAGGWIPLALTWTVSAVLGLVVVRGGQGRAVVVRGAVAAATCLLGTAAIAWLATGGFGTGSLASTGPHPLAVGLGVTLPMVAGMLFGYGVRQFLPPSARPPVSGTAADGDDDVS